MKMGIRSDADFYQSKICNRAEFSGLKYASPHFPGMMTVVS